MAMGQDLVTMVVCPLLIPLGYTGIERQQTVLAEALCMFPSSQNLSRIRLLVTVRQKSPCQSQSRWLRDP